MPRAVAARPFSWELLEPYFVRSGWSIEELGRRAAAPGGTTSQSSCRRRVHRWKVSGLSLWEADRVATALEVWPPDVWGDLWWSVPSVVVDVDAVFRGLRARERRLRAQRVAAGRRRRVVVRGYEASERARARGPHVCAPEGCCGSRNATRNVERGIAA